MVVVVVGECSRIGGKGFFGGVAAREKCWGEVNGNTF